jgi:hypothetical protein
MVKLPDEPQLWQVKFKSGQGQQIAGTSEGDVRKKMVKIYGEDYEIESVEPIAPTET